MIDDNHDRTGPLREEMRSEAWWYVLDTERASTPWLPRPSRLRAVRMTSSGQIRRDASRLTHGSIWVVVSASDLRSLREVAFHADRDARLIVLDRVDEAERHFLTALFRHVVLARDGVAMIDLEALPEVLAAPNRGELFIAGAIVAAAKSVVLYTGSVEPMVIPLAWFASGSGKADADPRDIAIEDFGQTVRLGSFEASADAILYEFDAGYRRRARKRSIDVDDSLGGSIRRLRLQKRLSRDDFGPVDAKTIARIERSEVARPRASTLRAIAEVLGVGVEELGMY